MERGCSNENTLAKREDNRQVHASRRSIEPFGSSGTREIILPIEKSIILVLYIIKMCIRGRRLTFDEKLIALQSLAWIISNTDFEGLVQTQPTLPTSKTNRLTDNNEEATI